LTGMIRVAKSEIVDMSYDDEFEKTIYITERHNIFLIYIGCSLAPRRPTFAIANIVCSYDVWETT
jgi:hypothetical protein